MDNPRLWFTSYHCWLDPSSGAAVCARDLLEFLGERGWRTGVFCGPSLDFIPPDGLGGLLTQQGAEIDRRDSDDGPAPFALYHFRLGATTGTIYAPRDPAPQQPSREEGAPFLALLDRVLELQRPDVMLSYGGHWLALEAMRLARRQGVAVVFYLLNFAYRNAASFQFANAVLVPSRFCADYYRRMLGLECIAIPPALNWARVQCKPDEKRRFVTFVNPQPAKGVFPFARIAVELGRRRPDIPLLVVEGRAQAKIGLEQTGLDLSGLANVHRMPNTPDPRDFYRVSRIVLMPSLWNESFGRVAAEAMINGIPVLASNRGALPEVLGDGGLLFEIPRRYTARTRMAPTAEEVGPWVDTIIRLWDDEAFYEERREKALSAAQAWRPERLAEQYDAFFGQFLKKRSSRTISLNPEAVDPQVG